MKRRGFYEKIYCMTGTHDIGGLVGKRARRFQNFSKILNSTWLNPENSSEIPPDIPTGIFWVISSGNPSEVHPRIPAGVPLQGPFFFFWDYSRPAILPPKISAGIPSGRLQELYTKNLQELRLRFLLQFP